ncbi:unnamed protein product [Spirodela intermedia]|uniref:WRKY domain-containing protein n=1 Tax=Spirodela intermedia TaxID=51605 RepID=A0A7I8J6U7_SPIIN|nr:unnamed protein product [Spirodela intermedia]CAA6665957.1 unnamed protein product [Spirodela intermedia]
MEDEDWDLQAVVRGAADRKNQQKKVVCQVPADSLSSDMWAWRKYGQKPIKGSPYPGQGYYRCSSSKGCLARKQVERSRTDPDTLVITYTAEHNHPVPTHRNSLAGSTRQKFPSSSSSAGSAQNFAGADGGGTSVGASDPEQTSSKGTSSGPLYSPTAAGFSPTTPLTSSMEEELLRPQRLTGRKAEGEEAEEDEEEDEDDEENLLLLEDMEMLGDDDLMFMDFDQLPEPNVATAFNDGFSERFGAPPHPWMPSGAATAAGGG